MNLVRAMTGLLMMARNCVLEKQVLLVNNIRKEISRELFAQQSARLEAKLTKALRFYFQSQITHAAKELEALVVKSTASDTAEALVDQIFEPQQWVTPLVDITLPILAQAMSEAAMSVLLGIGVDPRKTTRTTSKSTASDWLVSHPDLELPPGIAVDLPRWMTREISKLLKETFTEPYWQDIPKTTRNDIRKFLDQGLSEGLSIAKLAKQIHQAFPVAYSKKRALTVARTEAGNALNGARNASFQQVKQALGEAGTALQKEWLSVLSNTTRDSHADLDGVLANPMGLFSLGGVEVPWPGHASLPPEERINCQCTLTTSFGEINDLASLEQALRD